MTIEPLCCLGPPSQACSPPRLLRCPGPFNIASHQPRAWWEPQTSPMTLPAPPSLRCHTAGLLRPPDKSGSRLSIFSGVATLTHTRGAEEIMNAAALASSSFQAATQHHQTTTNQDNPLASEFWTTQQRQDRRKAPLPGTCLPW